MPGTLTVRLGHTTVGELTNVAGDYNIFAFDEEYLENEERPVLSQSLLDIHAQPRRSVPRTHVLAPAFFSNLLPETDSLLRAMVARQHSLKPVRDFPFLAVLGGDLPGAVEAYPIGELREPKSEPLTARDELPIPREPLRFSLAGLQLKFSVSMRGGRLTLPAKAGDSGWIVKLPSTTFPRLPENEFAVMSFARGIGLNVPEIRLVEVSQLEGLPDNLPVLPENEPNLAYAIERFDRRADGSRMHCEDLNQIANQWPRDKYDHRPTHWVGNVVQTLCDPTDTSEFLARLTFGICIGNCDMHLKNWAIAYPDGRNAALAPMYDFVCTNRYFEKPELALTVAGERAFARITMAKMEELATRASISAKKTRVVVRETVARIRAAWPEVRAGIPDDRLIDGIERNLASVPLMRG